MKNHDYFQKYLKYKNKYVKLKNNNLNINLNPYQTAGSKNNLVIHISGPSGAGKTTLGIKLKKEFGDSIVVKDIDDLRYEFIKSKFGPKEKIVWNSKAYQKYIDQFVDSLNKPLVWVGLNHMPWWNKNLYYNMRSNYNFYIDLDSDLIFKQKCARFMKDVFETHRDEFIEDIRKDEKKTIKNLQLGIKDECGYAEITKMNKIWNKYYKAHGYKVMSREEILDEVVNILEKNL